MPVISELLGEARFRPPHEMELFFKKGQKPTQEQLRAMTKSIFSRLQELERQKAPPRKGLFRSRPANSTYWLATDPELVYHFPKKSFWVYLNPERISLASKDDRLDLTDPLTQEILNTIKTADTELEIRPITTV